MIKAIFFDMGGVLVNLDRAACIKHFKEDLGFENINDFLDDCHHNGYLMDFEGGKISEQEFYDITRKYCRPGVKDSEIAAALCTLIQDISPDRPKLLHELKNRYPLYILSNNNPIAKRFCRQLFLDASIKWEDIFTDMFMSFEMNVSKPERAIFEESIRRSGYEPDEILFIDDSQTNVDAAISCGMNAVYYERGTSLRDTVLPALGL